MPSNTTPNQTANDDPTPAAPSISRARAAGFACLALGLGFAAALILGEIGVRLWFRDVPPNLLSNRQFYRPSANELRVYEPVPEHTTPEGDVINTLGLRGPETELEKPDGVFRIVVLGDSYTFGQGVAEADTWVRKLEGILDARLPLDFEVLNFGVPGYNTKNELGSLQRALDFDPDLVLVAHLVHDDLWDIFRVSYGTLVFQSEADLDALVPLPRRIKRGLYRRSLLYRLVATHVLRRLHRRAGDPDGHGGELRDEALAGWQNDDDGIDAPRLEQIFATCRRLGLRVAIVQIPLTRAEVQTERAEEEQRVTDSLRRLTARRDVPMLDLFPQLQGFDGARFQVAPGDTHPNAELHDRYARRIADWLIETFASPAVDGPGGGSE